MTNRTPKAASAPTRRGATTVEFAMVAPVLFAMVLAGIEFSRTNLVVHTTKIAAVEGARRGIVQDGAAQDCRDQALDELAVIGVGAANVTVTPSPLTQNDDTVTVHVSVPVTASNGFTIQKFILGSTIESTVTLSRETAMP